MLYTSRLLQIPAGIRTFRECAPSGSTAEALKASGNLLLAFSGGLGSTLLLDLAYQAYFANRQGGGQNRDQQGGKDHPRNAPIWPKGSICYVEICGAFPGVSVCHSMEKSDIRTVT